jgi:hypothetical protein
MIINLNPSSMKQNAFVSKVQLLKDSFLHCSIHSLTFFKPNKACNCASPECRGFMNWDRKYVALPVIDSGKKTGSKN